MKTIWFCMLLSFLSILAYGGFSDALSGAGQPLFETPASPSTAAPSQSLDTPVGPIALDASSGRRVSRIPGNDAGLAARLSEYVFLHETRNERIPAKTATGLSTCPE
jgi:hypothetical protein